MNYLLFNSAHYKEYDHLNQLVTEATVKDLQIEMNTYVKILVVLYNDADAKFDRSEFIQTLFTLFQNDHNTENFALGNELIKEYLWTN